LPSGATTVSYSPPPTDQGGAPTYNGNEIHLQGRSMRWLVTAGGTLVEIDAVRAISNGFTGRTGAAIAAEARRRGRDVTLLASHAEVALELPAAAIRPFKTFDDLHRLMFELMQGGSFDCLVHSAAVSDYRPANVYSPALGTAFDERTDLWRGEPPRLI